MAALDPRNITDLVKNILELLLKPGGSVGLEVGIVIEVIGMMEGLVENFLI